jgi:hypothetical protein
MPFFQAFPFSRRNDEVPDVRDTSFLRSASEFTKLSVIPDLIRNLRSSYPHQTVSGNLVSTATTDSGSRSGMTESLAKKKAYSMEKVLAFPYYRIAQGNIAN